MNSISIRNGLLAKIDSYQVIKNLVIQHFNSNLTSGWLDYESRLSTSKHETTITRLTKKEKSKLHILESDLERLCQDDKAVDYLIGKIQEESQEIVRLLNDNNYSFNMKDKVDVDVG